MFKSKIAQLIDEAVQDCIANGYGKATHYHDGVNLVVEAAWSETDIEITIFENCCIRFCFTEPVPEQYR